MSMSHEDAITLLVQWLRAPDHGTYSRYGYDVYLPTLIANFLMKEHRMAPNDAQRGMHEMISDFYAPAWELVSPRNTPVRNPQIWRRGNQ